MLCDTTRVDFYITSKILLYGILTTYSSALHEICLSSVNTYRT